MTNIIVVFSKPEDGRNIKGILVRNGFQVVAVCISGDQVLSAADYLDGRIVVSGYRFGGVMYDELRQYLSEEFDILLISPPARWSGQSPDRTIYLPMSLKIRDLLSTLEMMVQAQERIRRRRRGRPRECSKEERGIITETETLLMKRNNMTESEAHRYIQKCNMNSGTNLVGTAQMIISLVHV